MNTSGNPAAADFSAGRSLVGRCVEPSSPGQTDRLSACTRPITAVIITLNGATHLGRVLESVGLCSERLVLDSGSTDGTVALACAAGARVEQQAFLGYGLQKQHAVQLATHDWILSLDDDEVLDPEASDAICRLDLSDPLACWSIRRRTFIGAREMHHGPWKNDCVLRLFNRQTAAFKPLMVHEQVQPQRPPQLLPGSVAHYSYDNCCDLLARALRYAPLKAGLMHAKRQRVHTWMLPLRGLATFVRCYYLQGGWRDGAAGFAVALSRVIDATLPRTMLLLGEADEATKSSADQRHEKHASRK